MRRVAGVLALSLLVLLPACGGGNGAARRTASPSDSPSLAETVRLTTAQVDAALLTAADLGDGWTAGEPEDGETATPSESPASPQSTCDFDQITSGAVYVSRTRDLEHTETSAVISQQVEGYERGAAARVLTEASALFDRCKTFSDDESGVETTMTVSPFEGAPKLGEQSVAMKLAATVGNVQIDGAIVLFRKGDTLCAIFGLVPSEDSDELVLLAARAAEEKLPKS